MGTYWQLPNEDDEDNGVKLPPGVTPFRGVPGGALRTGVNVPDLSGAPVASGPAPSAFNPSFEKSDAYFNALRDVPQRPTPTTKQRLLSVVLGALGGASQYGSRDPEAAANVGGGAAQNYLYGPFDRQMEAYKLRTGVLGQEAQNEQQRNYFGLEQAREGRLAKNMEFEQTQPKMVTGADGKAYWESRDPNTGQTTIKPATVQPGSEFLGGDTNTPGAPTQFQPFRPLQSVPAGGALVNPVTGQTVATGLEKESTPTFQEQTYQDWLKSHPGGDHFQFQQDNEKRRAQMQADAQARGFAHQEKMQTDRQNFANAKQQALTGPTRTMIEAAPHVKDFVQRINTLIDQQEKQLGPAAGRWSEFMTGKVGAPNPAFARLRTDVGLLQTLLMRMHVGARGGEYIMHHFQSMIDAGGQSPENLKAALDEINKYADDLMQTKQQMGGGGSASVTPQSIVTSQPARTPTFSEWKARQGQGGVQ